MLIQQSGVTIFVGLTFFKYLCRIKTNDFMLGIKRIDSYLFKNFISLFFITFFICLFIVVMQFLAAYRRFS